MSVKVTDGPNDHTASLTLPNGVVVDLTRSELTRLREEIDQWGRENRKFRRRRGLQAQVERANYSLPREKQQPWPPDPVWGTNDRGQFRYTDYDGESLWVWRDKDGELWIDKRGEGPVYVRSEDVPVIVEAIK